MPPSDVSAEVTSNRLLSADYNVIELAAPAIAAAALPGQFVMVRPGVGHDPLLRRPFSVFEVLRDAGGTHTGISLLNKRIGVSTELLYIARAGQRIACLGPLGRPFTPVDPPVDAWMVAGGVGLAPFATLAASLRERGVRATLFYGARSDAEHFHLDFFRRLAVELVLIIRVRQHGATPSWRRSSGRVAARSPSARLMLYACGPEGMLAATAKVAARYGRPCQVSVERIMGCGLGGCYSCVVPMRGDDGRFHHVRSCLAGPVLAGDQILWD